MASALPDFVDTLNEIMPVIIKEFNRRQIDEVYKGKVTISQIVVMEFLKREGESKMTQLADFMRVSTAAMTGLIDRLVKYNYVTRVFDPQDRRVIKIKLTSKGEELIKKIDSQRRKMMMHIFSKISETDRKNYLRILLQIKKILLEEGE